MVEHRIGGGDLFDLPRTHDRDAIRHRQRLFLVMGDEDCSETQSFDQLPKLDLHRAAQLCVEGAEWFI